MGRGGGPRPAVEADLEAVRRVTDAAYGHYVARIGIRPAPMDADHAAEIAAGHVHVTGPRPQLPPGAPPVSGVVVLVPRADHLFLDSIAVHPEAHGTGLGRQLLEYAEERARALGLPEIRLYTNALMWENQRLYPRFGYEFTERRVDGVYDRLHYRKAVPTRRD
ncbi:GNAT family N-acetyltransferase [Streptomyces sp. NPDC101132]|uniref:GNAT family N-acetyltransferase n=1 Tax=Streptomyces sp. NPDC101132 TaxID=3366110 RepID=UPI0038200BE5